jgi:hypothetical protein
MSSKPRKTDGVEVALLKQQISHLDKTVQELVVEVKTISALLNRGKGAFTFAMLFSGVLGASISRLVHSMFER